MKVQYYTSKEGNAPVTEWLESLKKSKKAWAAATTKIERLKFNLFGDCKSLRDGVSELRIKAFGLRIYFANVNGDTVLLLCAGDKSSRRGQDKDIKLAIEYLEDYKTRG